MARFNSEKMTMEDPIDDMVYATLYQVLSPAEPLMKKLAWKQRSTLQRLMDKVADYNNQEETLKNMISARRPRESASEK